MENNDFHLLREYPIHADYLFPLQGFETKSWIKWVAIVQCIIWEFRQYEFKKITSHSNNKVKINFQIQIQRIYIVSSL